MSFAQGASGSETLSSAMAITEKPIDSPAASPDQTSAAAERDSSCSPSRRIAS